MKPTLLLAILLFLTSCGQITKSPQSQNTDSQTTTTKFENIDFSKFNIKLSQKTEKMTPKEVMQLYYPHKKGDEGNEQIILSEKILNNKNTEVTLIHEGLLDDSIRGYQYKMILKKKKDHWKVASLKKNWKCYRGHSYWGIELCH